MATYAIGDVQGCYTALRQLLDTLVFDPDHDRLWFTGDLVNRGPESLAVLRFIHALGERAVTVLGNHDLHLLAVAYGGARLRARDTLAEVLTAPDRETLLTWLRQQPLLHHDAALGITMVHAGLPPQWTLAQAQDYAAEVSQALRGPSYQDFCTYVPAAAPTQWSSTLGRWERLGYITRCLTQLRFCDPYGRLAEDSSGPPGTQPPPYLPWFAIPQRASADCHVVFGHWAALGRYQAPGIDALDSGCVWGGALTALCLETGVCTRVACAAACASHTPPERGQ